MLAVGGGEEQYSSEHRQRIGDRAHLAGFDVFDHSGILYRPVALPQLEAVFAVDCCEVEPIAHCDQLADVRSFRLRAWVDVLDELGAFVGSIALPQLDAVFAVVCREEYRLANERHVIDPRAAGAVLPVRAGVVGGGGSGGVDVLDELGASVGPICFPQLDAVFAVVCPEVEPIANDVQLFDLRATCEGAIIVGVGVALDGVDVLDELGASVGPVALPQLDAVFAVVGREEYLLAHDRHGVRMAPALGDAALALVAAGSGAPVGVDVLDELGALLGPVCFPQLLAVILVPRPEERRSRGCGHDVFGIRSARAGCDVLDNLGATLGPVAFPQLLAVLGGGSLEVDPLFGEQHTVGRRRTGLRLLHFLYYQGTGVYVLDEPCA